MSSIQELKQEAYKVIHETQEGGNSASRIGNLYNGIIDFLGVLDDRTVDPYYYDDSALKEALRRVDNAIADLDSALDAAIQLANQERQRLDDLVNTIDGEITDKVEGMLNDAQWLEAHAQGIQQAVNEGEILWKSEWDQNIEAYLQEVGVWAREGDVIKTQWTEVVQSVSEITSTVAEVQQDLAGRPTSTQWSQISQKVNGIEQTVNALLYQGDVTEALQSSINQSIDGKVAALKLDTTYAKIDTEGSKEIIEWMYSALRNETTSEKTFNDIVSAGKSGLLNGISNIHTYVEVVRNGEVLEHVAGAAIEAKVNDAITGLYSKATDHDATTTLFSQVKKDTSDIAAIVVSATGDTSSATIATKFDRWKAGLVIKSDLDSATASLVAAMDAKDNAAALVLEQKIGESAASLTTQMNNKVAGLVAKSDFNTAMAAVVAKSDYNAATIVAYVNNAESGIQIAADKIDFYGKSINLNAEQINFKSGSFQIKNGSTTTFSVDSSGNVTMTGTITSTNATLSGQLLIQNGNSDGLKLASDGSIQRWNKSMNTWVQIYAGRAVRYPSEGGVGVSGNKITVQPDDDCLMIVKRIGNYDISEVYIPISNFYIGKVLTIRALNGASFRVTSGNDFIIGGGAVSEFTLSEGQRAELIKAGAGGGTSGYWYTNIIGW